MTDDEMQRLKKAKSDAVLLDQVRQESRSRWALQTPSGNIIGMGRERPKLTKEDQRNFWRAIRLGK